MNYYLHITRPQHPILLFFFINIYVDDFMAFGRYMRRTDIRDTWRTLHMMEDNGLYRFLLCYSFFLWTLDYGFVPNSAVRMEQVPAKYRLVTCLILEDEYHKKV